MIKKTKNKKLISMAIAIAVVFGITPMANAMHIMEGYLPVGYCVAWGAICIPFLLMGYSKIKKLVSENRKAVSLLAIAGAFVFVISSLKIPSVTGSCSHMTGTGLAAILFGPFAASVLSIIVLIFQAIMLAHGGITSLGANTFSMGIAGPFIAYGVYILLKKSNVNRSLCIFFAAFLGDLLTYVVTAFQLAIAYPAVEGGFAVSLAKFLGVFAPTQLPLAIVEGILTVLIVMGLETYAKSELSEIGFEMGGIK